MALRLLTRSVQRLLAVNSSCITKYQNPAQLRSSRTLASAAQQSATVGSVDDSKRLLNVQWSCGSRTSVLPLAWLRDNCQCSSCFHPVTMTRRQFLEDFDPMIEVCSLKFDDSKKVCWITWSDRHNSEYGYDWLMKRSFDPAAQQARMQWYGGKHQLWGADYNIRKHKFVEVRHSDKRLLEFLKDTETFGLTVLEGAPTKGEAGKRAVVDLCHQIGFPTETNYGMTFSVTNKQNPSNLAYTPAKLGLHADMPFYKEPPGVQFLHRLIQSDSVRGGENLFVDGFYAANLLKASHPEAYRILTTQLVDFWDYGTDHLVDFHLLCRQTIISLNRKGDHVMICYNDQHRDSYLSMPPEEVQNFYNALKLFDQILNGQQCIVMADLKEGDIVVFDNRRVLHGRKSFTVEGAGERHLEGAYVRWDEVYSRIRRLKESAGGESP